MHFVQRIAAQDALALETGARPSELLGLQWKDIDFDQGRVTIQRSLEYPDYSNEFRFRVDSLISLFISQRDHRIHFHRAPSRHITRKQPNGNQQYCDGTKRQRINRGHLIERI